MANGEIDESPFLTWFREQFGWRPSLLSIEELRSKANSAAMVARMADEIYQETLLWEQRRDTALKAWCARDGEVRHGELELEKNDADNNQEADIHH